jgi:hypothetical protein
MAWKRLQDFHGGSVAKNHTQHRAELVYPKGLIQPEDWLRFMELSPFTRRRAELGFTDEDIRALQIGIMIKPDGSPVIPGTGGLRKMRFARKSERRGKRDSYRVLFVHFPKSGLVALVTAYGKNEKDNIDAHDKKLFKEMIHRIETALSDGKIR